MDRRGLWVLLNLVNVLATGGVSLIWWWRGRAAREALCAALRGPVALASHRRQLARNRDYATGQSAISGGLCALGAALIGVALAWAGPVPLFVVGGTGAFAAIWLAYATLAALDWRWLRAVAELREAEREAGC